MILSEPLQNQTAIAGIMLIVSGFMSLTMRRHLIQGLLGFYLTVLGAVMLIVSGSPSSSRWTVAVVVAAALLLLPVMLTVFARWRIAAGSADRSTLQEDPRDGRSD